MGFEITTANEDFPEVWECVGCCGKGLLTCVCCQVCCLQDHPYYLASITTEIHGHENTHEKSYSILNVFL